MDIHINTLYYIQNLKIKWYDVLQTNQQTIKTIDLGGQINVGA